LPPFPEAECAVSEALVECNDPSREDELAFEASQKKDEDGDGGDADGDEEEEES
jgi:hypothetical protein